MNEVEKFLNAYDRARSMPSDENLLKLVEALLPFAPPGIEWGIEISSVAGMTYLLEDGRVIAVKVSRDEFGPFMQTSVTPVGLEAIPASALKNIRDVESFVQKTASHLGEWARKMPANNRQKQLVEQLLLALR
ncbi:MAG: hypothetical protein RMI43_01660 [Candidatus Caldarchaeum sp.]|nr:hypothetical protein [Candidatus Caldarchaeum sp.]MDW8062859.1 hypothetical protein [Candidatus Caldarchaeum sp.]